MKVFSNYQANPSNISEKAKKETSQGGGTAFKSQETI